MEAILEILRHPIAEHVSGAIAFLLLPLSFMVHKRTTKYILAFFTAIATMEYSYATEGYWMVAKWSIMIPISIYQYRKYKNMDKVCEVCL